MRFAGKALKYGDNVDTDVITHGALAQATGGDITDMQALARACMSGIDPDFYGRHRPGDLIVAGRNFGCGSSREHAPLAIKAAEISCVIAKSFARIFYRNAINIGFPVIECPGLHRKVKESDVISVDLEAGLITLGSGETIRFAPPPPNLMEILRAGGLVPKLRADLDANSDSRR